MRQAVSSQSMSDNAQKPVLVVCGPTASGKSALALNIARAFDGVVINADSMQVYRELRILTARPDDADLMQAPHRLYGIVSVTDVFSAGRWRELAVAEIRTAHEAGKLPIICGGTGFYIRALTEGLSKMPDIPANIRSTTRQHIKNIGNKTAYHNLAERDPKSAAQLNPGDTQRVMRALEVLEATGRSLADWQADAKIKPDSNWHFHTILIEPGRLQLNRAIEKRFQQMIGQGALDEVASLDGIDGDLPALKAVGVPDLRLHLADQASLDEAVARAQTATRQFAKRQTTWFKNQIVADKLIKTQYSECLDDDIFSFIRNFVLTPSD
jgi:tRNA dimethylallyltransferase